MVKIRITVFTPIFLLLLCFNSYLYSQAEIADQKESGFILKINIPQFKYSEVKKGNYTQRDYYEFTDESSPGEPKLPHLSVALALPPDSKPDVKVIKKTARTERFVIPTLNPSVLLRRCHPLMRNQ